MGESLKKQQSTLSHSAHQLSVLEKGLDGASSMQAFSDKLKEHNQWPLKPTGIEIFQVNIGYMCNQTCKHCHVDAGPDRTEKMSKKHLERCLEIIEKDSIACLDITGGAPEMHPHFKWFVEKATRPGLEIIVRSNLTFLVQNENTKKLCAFFKEHKVRVVSSLPFYKKSRTDNQRGNGVFDKSIEALKLLNAQGYGKPESGLILDLVYNPAGAFLPPDQRLLEKEFKTRLANDFGIVFNSLFTITNLPISRFLDYLIASENYIDYMSELLNAFNPGAVAGVMCRNTISVDYLGNLYDCDFNQMLALKTATHAPQHIDDWDIEVLNERSIVVNQHCYGCTAGAGSSCQGATV